MTTKPASETPETDAAWQNFGQRSMRISGREITMVVRREDMRALERRLREAEQEILWDAEIIKSRDAQLEKWAAEAAARRSEGMVLVPKEPTRQLASSLCNCHPTRLDENKWKFARKLWYGLLNDAQENPPAPADS